MKGSSQTVAPILKDWKTRLLDAVIVISTGLLLYSVQKSDIKDDDLKRQLESKASIHFVQQQDSALSRTLDLKLDAYKTTLNLILQEQKASRGENQSNFQEIRNQLYKKGK